jgi:hypothetical protein
VREELRTEADPEDGRFFAYPPLEQLDLRAEIGELREVHIGDSHRSPHHDEQIVTPEIFRNALSTVERTHVEGVALLRQETGDSRRPFELGMRQNYGALHVFVLVLARTGTPSRIAPDCG